MVQVKHCRLRIAAVVAIPLAATLAGCGNSGGHQVAVAPPEGTVAAVRIGQLPGLGTVLVDQLGFTVYRDSSDLTGGIGTFACVGACLQVWSPLSVPPGDLAPVPGPGVPRGVGVVGRPDGATQVTFNGSPLYTYRGDTAPGQDHGQGIGATWSVVQVHPISTPVPTTVNG